MSEVLNVQINKYNGVDYDVIHAEAMEDITKAGKVELAVVDEKTKVGIVDYVSGWTPSHAPFTFYTEMPTFEEGVMVTHGTSTVETSISSLMYTYISQGKSYMTDAGYPNTFFYMDLKAGEDIVKYISGSVTFPIACPKITFKSNGVASIARDPVLENSVYPVSSRGVFKYAATKSHASQHATSGTDPLTATDVGAASKTLYTSTITTSWTTATTGYYQTIPISGILATDTPVVGIVLTGTAATDQTLLDNWGLISRIVTTANAITVYAYGDAPAVALPLQILCVR